MSQPTVSPPRPLRDTRGPDQVTGDAVLLDLPAAGIATRVLAGVVDLLVRVVFFVGAVIGLYGLLGDGVSDAVRAGVMVIVMAVCFVLAPALFETLTMGRSVGKWACSLRVVRTDGGAISFRHALVRAFLGWVEIVASAGTIAFVTAMLTVRSRRLGDLAAGTYVVREVRRLQLPPAVAMPPQLAGWANHATVTPLPPGLSSALTTLARGSTGVVSPAYRYQVDRALAAVLPHVSPPPPPGHDPVAVLVAVAVLRRDADLRMLQREEATRARVLNRGA